MTRTEVGKKVVFVLAAFFMVFVSALAKNSRKVNFAYLATLNGTQVAAGNYEVTWQTHSPEATVTIADRKRLMVATNGRWEERNTKYESNAVVYDTNDDGSRSIIEIRFAGLAGALVFDKSSN
ncbi:MAG TPA: hypothetical protein VKV95_14540 [Terriglobia bacterium]|nr:hypothetical protein [Terriglobia bacterium]